MSSGSVKILVDFGLAGIRPRQSHNGPLVAFFMASITFY